MKWVNTQKSLQPCLVLYKHLINVSHFFKTLFSVRGQLLYHAVFLPYNNIIGHKETYIPSLAPHPQPTPRGHHRAPSWAPCVTWQPPRAICLTQGDVCVSMLPAQAVPVGHFKFICHVVKRLCWVVSQLWCSLMVLKLMTSQGMWFSHRVIVYTALLGRCLGSSRQNTRHMLTKIMVKTLFIANDWKTQFKVPWENCLR